MIKAFTISGLIIINFIISPLFGQKGYYATNNCLIFGIDIISKGDYWNSRVCRGIKDNESFEFTPYDITEYGLNNGTVYLSKEIKIQDSTQRVFLERLVKGKFNLYYYKGKNFKTFFLEKDSLTLFELHGKSNNYRSILTDLANDCSKVSNAIKLVSYNKKSLADLVERYNKCELKPFPFFKYGIIFGREFYKLIPVSNSEINYINEFKYKYEKGFTAGIFIDNPIDNNYFSIHGELSYSKSSFSYSYTIENKDFDLLINLSSFSFPLLIRYTYPSLKLQPFINGGGVFSVFIDNKNGLYEAVKADNIVWISKIDVPLLYKNQLGYNIGGGVQYNLDYRRSIFIELRYNRLYGIKSSGSFHNEFIQLMTGVNF